MRTLPYLVISEGESADARVDCRFLYCKLWVVIQQAIRADLGLPIWRTF
jgi:hypothetical protein